ncbi:hypothetical protein [Endozoicomonas sp. ALC020]
MDTNQHNTQDNELKNGELIILSLSLGSVLASLHFFLNTIF